MKNSPFVLGIFLFMAFGMSGCLRVETADSAATLAVSFGLGTSGVSYWAAVKWDKLAMDAEKAGRDSTAAACRLRSSLYSMLAPSIFLFGLGLFGIINAIIWAGPGPR